MNELTDEQILDRIRAATREEERRELTNVLFQRYYQKVALWCLRWSGDRNEASDLAQETFARVYRSLDSFQGSSKFSTWLYTVCRNHCTNAGQARKLRETEELGETLSATLQSSEPSPEARLEASRKMEKAREMLEGLDDVERKVILLHFSEEMTLPAVTRALGLTNASGAKAYLVSAQRKLKSALARTRKHLIGERHESR